MSKTSLGGIFVLFLRKAEDRHTRGDKILNNLDLFGAKNRDLSAEDVAESAIFGCGCTFHFFKEDEKRVLVLNAVAFKVLRLHIEELCAKSRETVSEHFVEWGPVQRG